MHLSKLAKPTPVIKAGMLLMDFFRFTVEHNVKGLPYVDESGKIIGRLSLRHCFRETCLPHYVIHAAHMLGDSIDAVDLPRIKASEILSQPVESFVKSDYAVASSKSPIVKGLAIMEQLDTSYIFLVDDGKYEGIVTHMAIAKRVLHHADTVKL